MKEPGAIQAVESHAEPAGEARLLRGATLVLFQASDDPVRDRHWLCGPLSRAVASHTSRKGQMLCAELGVALASGDHAGAIDACSRLIRHDISSVIAPLEACQ